MQSIKCFKIVFFYILMPFDIRMRFSNQLRNFE